VVNISETKCNFLPLAVKMSIITTGGEKELFLSLVILLEINWL